MLEVETSDGLAFESIFFLNVYQKCREVNSSIVNWRSLIVLGDLGCSN